MASNKLDIDLKMSRIFDISDQFKCLASLLSYNVTVIYQ